MKITTLVLAMTVSSVAVANDFLPSGNGEIWDQDDNWSETVYPNAPGAYARIGVPTAFKKNKGWRNIHIDSHDIVVGLVEMNCGGCTNRIDTGSSGGLTFDGNGSDAAFAMTDESGAGLAMIDLDAPNVVTLASHATFTVSNSVGCCEFGGIRLSGVWNGNGKNLKKSGPGLMTIDFTNAVGTAFSKIQVEEGVLAILRPIAAESITKSGECRVSVSAETAAAAANVSVMCSDKVSVDNVSLFVSRPAGGQIVYGGVVAAKITTAVENCKVYVPDDAGMVHFNGASWSVCDSATVEVVDAGDGTKTFAVTIPAAPEPGPVPVSAFVSFATTAPAIGRPIVAKVEGTGLTDLVFRWTAWEPDGFYGEVRASTAGEYTPTEADLEHWIRVEVFQDGVRLCESQLYFSRLPVVYLDTDDGMPVTVKEEYKGASLVIQGNAEFKQQYAGKTQVKGRGNSSWLYPQKPLKLKLDKKADLFGFGKNKHWVLVSNFNDKSFMRNKVAGEIARCLGLDAMDMTWVDVVYNGSYHGVYMLCEHVRVGPDRVDIFNWDDEAESIADGLYEAAHDVAGWVPKDQDALEVKMDEDLSWIGSGAVEYKGVSYSLADYELRKDYDLTGGYLFELSAQYDEVSKFITRGGLKVMVNTPEFLYTEPLMMGYVESLWNQLEAALESPDGCAANGRHFSDIVDVESLAAFWLVNEVMGNGDSQNSRFCNLDMGGKLVFGPVWDFDYSSAAWGMYSNPHALYTFGADIVDNFFRRWMVNPLLCRHAHELYWTKLRPWVEQNLSNQITDMTVYLAEAGEAQDHLWCGYPSVLHPDAAPRTFGEDSVIFQNFMRDHLAWLDEQFATVETLKASLAKALGFDPNPPPVEPPEEPVVEPVVTNTITYLNLEGAANPNPTEFTTNDLPLTLGPVAREGYGFLGWTPDGGVIPAGTVTNVTFMAIWEEEDNPNRPQIVSGAKVVIETGLIGYRASGLPKGLTYSKTSGKITGTPSKTGDYEVVLNPTTKYGTKETVRIPVSVTAMPMTAVGTFGGFVSLDGGNYGTVALTTTAAGKLMAKVVTAAGTVSFSGMGWDSVEAGVYRARLTTKDKLLTLALDTTAAWDTNQLSGEFATASATYSVSAQRQAFGKSWYFSATGNAETGWALSFVEDAKAAALTVTLKADGKTSITGKLPNGIDTKGKANTLSVSASGYANVGGMRDGAIRADFVSIKTVGKAKKPLSIQTNLWFDRSNEHADGIGEARFVK